MITLAFDIATHTAKLVQTATIKTGGDVPVVLLFSADPGNVDSLQLALASTEATPAVLAFTEDLSQESPRRWVGLLDATDTRLRDHLAAQNSGSAIVHLELVATLGGVRNVLPNIALTVQRRVITGPETSEGGPHYYTTAQTNAAIAAAVAGAVGTVRQGTVAIPAGQSYVNVAIAGGGFSDTGWFLESAMVINNVDPTPDNIGTGIQTAVTATTFVQHFGGKAPTANYFFKYVCKKY